MKQVTGLCLLLVAAVATMAFAGSAAAHRGHSHNKVIVVDSKISIKFKGGGDDPYAEQANFSGRVRADARRRGHHGHHHHRTRGGSQELEAMCVKDRKVEIFRKGGPRIARTRTDRKGDYGVFVGRDFVAGKKYLAIVDTTTLRQGKTKVVCKGAASDVITAG